MRVLLSPYSSKATVPVTPSNEALLTASIVALRADLADFASFSEVFRPSMMALAAS